MKIILLLLSIKSAFSANILFASSIPSPSHHIWNRALAVGLANKGHNVTLAGPDEDKLTKPVNYNHILLEGVYDAISDNFNINEFALYGPTKVMLEYKEFCIFSCKKILKSQGLQHLLNYPKEFKFDLIIFDVTIGSCLYPLLQRFKYPPSVGVTAFLLPSYVSFNFGNHLYPSYIPWYALPYTPEMSFVERVWNFAFTYVDIILRKRLYEEEHEEAKKIFGKGVPPMEELERHVSLLLTNTDPLLDYPQPLPPSFIPVGGLHTRKSKKLPQELQNLLDNSKNGVIVFSLGTNVRSDKLVPQTQKALLEAFSKLSETVIWKFESEIENLPKNVIVRKWLPQNDILGHPNVRLFIGHGGALSTQESIFHGVPMICVPFFSDQHLNTKRVVNKKLGLYLDFKRITPDYVLKSVREILDNPMYSKNMQRISTIFKDRTETPLERGIFWVEYVMRHGGAEFLNIPARNLPFYKSSGLDVILFLCITSILLIAIIYKSIKFVVRSISNKEKIKTN